jgi:hypothetical protein
MWNPRYVTVKLAILDKYFIVLFQILNLEQRKVSCGIIQSNIDAMRAAEDDTLMGEGNDDDDDDDVASSKSIWWHLPWSWQKTMLF